MKRIQSVSSIAESSIPYTFLFAIDSSWTLYDWHSVYLVSFLQMSSLSALVTHSLYSLVLIAWSLSLYCSCRTICFLTGAVFLLVPVLRHDAQIQCNKCISYCDFVCNLFNFVPQRLPCIDLRYVQLKTTEARALDHIHYMTWSRQLKLLNRDCHFWLTCMLASFFKSYLESHLTLQKNWKSKISLSMIVCLSTVLDA